MVTISKEYTTKKQRKLGNHDVWIITADQASNDNTHDCAVHTKLMGLVNVKYKPYIFDMQECGEFMSSTNGTCTSLIEPVLDGVLAEDKSTIRDIISVLHSLKICSSWAVNPTTQGYYDITGIIDSKKDVEIDLDDLELIQKVDPLRIRRLGMRFTATTGGTPSVWIRVLRKGEPVVLEEQTILRIQKKRRFLSWR